MTSFSMAPAAKIGGVLEGFLALPRSPMAVEFGFMFGGSEIDRSEGIRFGISASGTCDGVRDCVVLVSGEPLSDRSISSGVAGIDSESLMPRT